MKIKISSNEAFTLIEILVVVLIIGILAAIALPQYQLAVAKSEFSTLKAKTRALAEAINRYKLSTGTLPRGFGELDIELPNFTRTPRVDDDTSSIWIYFNNSHCAAWRTNYSHIYCSSKGNKMRFYFNYKTLKPSLCLTYNDYEPGQKVCQQETGKTIEQSSDDEVITWYEY